MGCGLVLFIAGLIGLAWAIGGPIAGCVAMVALGAGILWAAAS